MTAYTVPLFLRGQVITDDLVRFDTRIGAAQFAAPDMGKYVQDLPLKSPAEMSDLYELSFDEILDVLAALGDALDFESNTHLQEAYEASLIANVVIVVTGGAVRLSDSGLGCPTWPACQGALTIRTTTRL